MEETESIEVDVKMNAKDYRRVLVWLYQDLLIIGVLLTVSSIFAAYYLLDIEVNRLFGSRQSTSFKIFVFSLTLPFILACVTYFEIWRTAKKNEKLKEPVKIVFTDKGLEATTKSSSSQYVWNGFKKIIETSKDFILFPKESGVFNIPKRCFNSDSQAVEFKQLIIEKLRDKAKLKKNL